MPMVEVGRYATRGYAELARALLAEAGIPCVLAFDEPGAFLLVAEADAGQATVILSRFEPSDDR